MTDRGGYEQSLIDVRKAAKPTCTNVDNILSETVLFFIQLENSFDYLKETIPKYGRFVKNPVYVRLQDVLKGNMWCIS